MIGCDICIILGDTCPVCLDKTKANKLLKITKTGETKTCPTCLDVKTGEKQKTTHPAAQNERMAGALHCLADCISKLERIIPTSHKDEDSIKNTIDSIDWVLEEFDEFK